MSDERGDLGNWGIYNELWLQMVRLMDLRKEIKRERKRVLERLRGEMRAKYLKEVFLEVHPLSRALYRYLDNHTLTDLLNFCISVNNKKASDLYSRPRLLGFEMEELDSKLSPLIEWLATNEMPDGTHRNSRHFKNLVIYWVLKGLCDDRIRHAAKKILSMTRDKRETEIMGWVSWVRRKREKGQRVAVNLGEIRIWVKEAKASVRV
jgi:hypothetical protein